MGRWFDLIGHKPTDLRHASVVMLSSASTRIRYAVVEVDIAVVVVRASECFVFVLHLL